jgi:hypothetical protein
MTPTDIDVPLCGKALKLWALVTTDRHITNPKRQIRTLRRVAGAAGDGRAAPTRCAAES